MPAATAADMQAKLSTQRLQATLQRTQHAGGDAGGMPVHAHYRAERLEPEGMGQAAQELVAAVVMDDRLADHGAEPRHALGKPWRNPAPMQRQVGASGSLSHGSLSPDFEAVLWVQTDVADDGQMIRYLARLGVGVAGDQRRLRPEID